MRGDDDEMVELRRRAASNDHLRVGGPVSFSAAMPDDPDIGPDREIPCADCGTATPISGFAWWAASVIVRGLLEKGHKAEDLNRRIKRCDRCQRVEEEHRRARAAELAAKIGEAIKRAREDTSTTLSSEMHQIVSGMRRIGEHEAAASIEAIYARRAERARQDSQAGPGRRGQGTRRPRGRLDDSVT